MCAVEGGGTAKRALSAAIPPRVAMFRTAISPLT